MIVKARLVPYATHSYIIQVCRKRRFWFDEITYFDPADMACVSRDCISVDALFLSRGEGFAALNRYRDAIAEHFQSARRRKEEREPSSWMTVIA